LTAPAAAEAPPTGDLPAAYAAWLAVTGRGNRSYSQGARAFFARWPDPAAWASEPLAVRLGAGSQTRPLLNFLMLHGHLRPGYDYLLERRLSALARELAVSPLADDLDRFVRAAAELGYAPRPRVGIGPAGRGPPVGPERAGDHDRHRRRRRCLRSRHRRA
jgi:hypothetical protein